MAIQIAKEVFTGLEAVRRSGATNMFDRPRVIELLEEMGFDESADWVRNHRSEYANGIFQGFEAVGDNEETEG